MGGLYIYMCVCVCECVSAYMQLEKKKARLTEGVRERVLCVYVC